MQFSGEIQRESISQFQILQFHIRTVFHIITGNEIVISLKSHSGNIGIRVVFPPASQKSTVPVIQSGITLQLLGIKNFVSEISLKVHRKINSFPTQRNPQTSDKLRNRTTYIGTVPVIYITVAIQIPVNQISRSHIALIFPVRITADLCSKCVIPVNLSLRLKNSFNLITIKIPDRFPFLCHGNQTTAPDISFGNPHTSEFANPVINGSPCKTYRITQLSDRMLPI